MSDDILDNNDTLKMTVRVGRPTDKAAIRAREKQAVSLRLSGMPYEEIAEIMGYSGGAAVTNLVMRALKRDVVVDVNQVVNEDMKRLDKLIELLWPIVNNPPSEWDFENMKPRELEVRSSQWQSAVDRLLKILERRAKYTGADAPTKVEVKEVSSEDELKNLLISARHDYDQQRALEAQNANLDS